MAYMNQEKKAKIAAALKAVMPKGWKYSLSVENHSTIVLTISEAPANLLSEYTGRTYAQMTGAWIEKHVSAALVPLFCKIIACLNLDNFDHSDLQSDYFDVGHYVRINIGRWDKPFINTESLAVAA